MVDGGKVDTQSEWSEIQPTNLINGGRIGGSELLMLNKMLANPFNNFAVQTSTITLGDNDLLLEILLFICHVRYPAESENREVFEIFRHSSVTSRKIAKKFRINFLERLYKKIWTEKIFEIVV